MLILATKMSDYCIFFEALRQVLPLPLIIREHCLGCTYGYLSQTEHDFCLNTGYGMQIYYCLQEALERMDIQQLHNAVKKEIPTKDYTHLLKTIQSDKNMQLKFCQFLLNVNNEYNDILSLCYDYDNNY